MKNKHGVLAALLAAAILIGNALVLPRLLGYAQGLPDGEVVTQQPPSITELSPLPELPEGYGEPYKLAFSRPLSEEEQQTWDELRADMGDDYDTWSPQQGADLTYTQRAYDSLIAYWRTTLREEFFQEFQAKTKVGDGTPGTILIDYGTATVCLGEATLTREAALPFMRMIAPVSGASRDGVRLSELDNAYEDLYWPFNWMQPQTNAHYSTTRSLTDREHYNQSRLKTEYLLIGLRPSTPLATAETQDGGLWFDAQTHTIHLPMKFELTDDEMLHYIELVDSLTRQAMLERVPDMINQQQAEQFAKEWSVKLFGIDTDKLFVFAGLYDEDFSGKSKTQPIWRVLIGPEDMLIRIQCDDYTFDGCEILLDARDGTLKSASRVHYSPDVSARADKTVKQVKAELKKKAVETVQTLFEGGRKPKKAVINMYNFVETKDSYNDDVDMMHEISYVVSMAGGVDYELSFTTGDYALTSYRYWPDGCKNMG